MTTSLQRALEEQKQQTAPDVQQIPGLLGVPLGGQRRVEVAGRNAYVYVRLRSNQSEVIQAYNNQVAPAYNLPVLVERQGNKYVVIGVDTARYENNWTSQSPFLPRHGNTHSFDLESGGGGDIAWIHMRQIVPLLVFPSGSAGADSLVVNPYTLRKDDGTWMYVGNTGTSSLSIYRPTGASDAIMALLYLDDVSGNPYFLINSGTVFSNSLTGTSQIAQYIPQTTSRDQIPLAAIRLITGTSQISWDNIYDVRQWVHAFTSGSSGGISSVAVQDEGVSQGSATTFNFVGDNVSATISGSVVRVYVTGSASGGSINTGTLDARYLKLDTSNDPLFGELRLSGTVRFSSDSLTGNPIYLVHTKKTGTTASVMVLDQYIEGDADIQSTALDMYRYPASWNSPKLMSPFISAYEDSLSGTIYGKFATHMADGVERISLHPHATGSIPNYIYDTSRPRSDGVVHTSFRVSGSQISHIDVSGTVYSNNSPLIKEAPVVTGSYVRRTAGWYNEQPTFLPFGTYTNPTQPQTTTDAEPYAATVDRTLTFIRFSIGAYVGGTNDANNYWNITLRRWTDNAVIATLTTNGSAGSTHLALTTTNFSIASMGSSGVGIIVRCTKAGSGASPGSIYVVGPMVEVVT